MPATGITEPTGCTVDSALRLWTTEHRNLVRLDVREVIHFSTDPFVHNCTAAGQRICLNHPQPYAQGASLAPPGLA
jgi:hypothetical protein